MIQETQAGHCLSKADDPRKEPRARVNVEMASGAVSLQGFSPDSDRCRKSTNF